MGLIAKLKANPFRVALSSLLLSNFCSLENRPDPLILLDRSLMETWLNLYVPDDAVSMEELIILRLDRSSGVYITTGNNNCCNSWCRATDR